MKHTDPDAFSFETLCFVTGISCLIFTAILKFLDNTHSSLFLWSGIIATSLGIIMRIGKTIDTSISRKKHKTTS